MEKQKSRFSRRSFLGTAAATTAVFTVVPRHVLGGPGNVAPSDKLNIAGVGVGGKGYSDLNSVASENIVALCDVDWQVASRAFELYPKAQKWKDYRRMLDKQKDIDAVIVATPDHMHAIISMAAITRGKHVYTQKPLTHTVYEARTLAQAARKYKVATQMGNQGQASEATRRVCEIIQDGAIGNVRHVHVWTNRPTRRLSEVYWPQGIDRPQETPTVPETLEWDLFLGHAPVRPYNPVYHPFQWRGWWDFGTGALGDMGCHQLDTVFRALKLGHPTSFQASSSLVNKETYPAASIVEYDFPSRKGMSPVTVTWYDGGLKPPRPEELEDGLQMGSGGTLYVGDNGKILDGRLIPETRRKAYKLPEKTLARSPGHYQEWIDACKGGKPGGANFDWAGPLTEVVLLGNIALRMEMKEQVSRHKLLWNPETFKITNLPDANQFLHTEYRKGWTL